MTVTVIDDFAGINGAAINAAKWNRQYEAGTSGFIQDGKGRLRFINDATNNYKKGSWESVATFGRGRYRADATIGRTSAGGMVNYIDFGFCATNPYDAAYTAVPITGYALEVRPVDGLVRLLKSQNEQLRGVDGTVTNVPLAETTLPGGLIPNGTVVHLEGEVTDSGVSVRVWLGAAARPTTPTLSSPDIAFASGEVKLGGMGWDPGTDVHMDWSALTYDDLAGVSAGPDQSVADDAVVTLEGKPVGGTWSQVSGPAVTLSAPVNDSDSTNVTFTANNPSTTTPLDLEFKYDYVAPPVGTPYTVSWQSKGTTTVTSVGGVYYRATGATNNLETDASFIPLQGPGTYDVTMRVRLGAGDIYGEGWSNANVLTSSNGYLASINASQTVPSGLNGLAPLTSEWKDVTFRYVVTDATAGRLIPGVYVYNATADDAVDFDSVLKIAKVA